MEKMSFHMMPINNHAVLFHNMMKTFMGSRGGEELLIRALYKDLSVFDPVEVADTMLRFAPNNCRWRRFASKTRKAIKSRSKAATAMKAQLMTFVQGK